MILLQSSIPAIGSGPVPRPRAAEAAGPNRADERFGDVVGTVTFAGKTPPPVVVPEATKDKRYPVEVDPKTHGLRHAVVHLVPLDGQNRPVSQGDLPQVTVDQKDWEFIPHVLAVQVGQPVRFTNIDNANHNVTTTAFEEKNSFNQFVPTDAPYTHRFVASKRPIKLSCSLHSWMWGWIYVFEHPYFAVTGATGEYSIQRVPIGRYRLVLRHQDAGVTVEREIVVTPEKQMFHFNCQ